MTSASVITAMIFISTPHRVDFQDLSKEPGPVPLRALGESVVGILDPCCDG